MKLVQLIYTSRAKGPVTLDLVHDIIQNAVKHNQAAAITGFLAFDNRHFLQVLEGGAGAVNDLYLKIAHDARHESVRIVSYGEVAQRQFPAWSMGDCHVGSLDRETILRFTPAGQFEPEKLSPQSAIHLLTQLEGLRERSGDRHGL